MRRRTLALIVVIAGLAPGWLLRDPPPTPATGAHAQLQFRPIPVTRALLGAEGAPKVVGAWHIVSEDPRFGSYSALLATGDGTLLALSDWGNYLRIPIPPPAAAQASIGAVFPALDEDKWASDIESAARDPATGRTWLGLEARNAITRLDRGLAAPRMVVPRAMRRWPVNAGAESLARLPDGRFIVLSEALGGPDGRTSEGLLFPGDPLAVAKPRRFGLEVPRGHYPSDIALLPDGRALLLLRAVSPGLPLRFDVQIVLADPATIQPGGDWQWTKVAEISSDALRENYEGLAITGGKDGGPVTLWLISDDNGAVWVQRTLLLQLEWTPPPRAQAATRRAGHIPNR